MVLLSALTIHCAFAQDSGSADSAAGSAADVIHFNLPAQPLPAALQSFVSVTELSVLVQNSLIEQRTSSPVQGDYSSREALQRMLAGTGLTVRFPSENAVAIVPLRGADPRATSSVTPAPSEMIAVTDIAGVFAAGADYRSYVSLVQQELREALCVSPQTRPGNYRLLVQFHITASGTLTAERVLDSTGDSARDAAIARTLRNVVFDLPPPAEMPQPVTILFRPQGGGINTDCTSSAEGG